MNTRHRITVLEAKTKYAKIDDSQIDKMQDDDHCMNRLMENLEKEFKTGLDRCPRKVHMFYKNRTLEQKQKYYKYKRKEK